MDYEVSALIRMSPGQQASRHPDEDMLELYALGRLPMVVSAIVRKHVYVCARCGRRLSRTQDFIAAITGALHNMRPDRCLMLMPRTKSS